LFYLIDICILDGKISREIRAMGPPAGILGNGKPLCTGFPPRAYGAVSLFVIHKSFLPALQLALVVYIYSFFKSRNFGSFGGFLQFGVIYGFVFSS